MTAARSAVLRDTFVDSVLLMGATRAMAETEGVVWATAVMATPANVAALVAEGIDAADLEGASANDLALAARGASPDAADAALSRGRDALFAERRAQAAGGAAPAARTVAEAVSASAGVNVAIVSVTGAYAALAAHHALTAGLHVLLFSDHVGVDEEVELKDRAARMGRLVMGPGAGTAILGGTGLGFANVVGAGRVGVVAAAGTGAQEVSSLLDRWGSGVSQVIGIGGRDLSAAVGGRMARVAIAALEADPGTDAILLVSKPPAEAVARDLLGAPRAKPLIAAVLGVAPDLEVGAGVRLCGTLEEGVVRTLEAVGVGVDDPGRGLAGRVAAAAGRLAAGRTAVRGLFSGGTLCYEAQLILAGHVGRVYSNAPVRRDDALPAPDGAHVCLDLGEEEYTRGRPHPMIDPQARLDLIRREAADPATAVLLLDVVLGHGSHPDPAGMLAPVCAEILAAPGAPAVVAYVLGTSADPQGYDRQRAILEEAGCVVTPTAARGAHAAAAIALRRPELAESS
ncbi:MAG TPA: protein FdrA [Candidatus Dormibacteraeota bacterium]|nr:protein FdrA [Candidatus Dormibacteraeota bacterium]